MRKYRNRNTKQYNSSMVNQHSESNMQFKQNKSEINEHEEAYSRCKSVRKNQVEPKSKFLISNDPLSLNFHFLFSLYFSYKMLILELNG